MMNENLLTKNELTAELIEKIQQYYPNAKFILDNAIDSGTVTRLFTLSESDNIRTERITTMDPVTFEPVVRETLVKTSYKIRVNESNSTIRSIIKTIYTI